VAKAQHGLYGSGQTGLQWYDWLAVVQYGGFSYSQTLVLQCNVYMTKVRQQSL